MPPITNVPKPCDAELSDTCSTTASIVPVLSSLPLQDVEDISCCFRSSLPDGVHIHPSAHSLFVSSPEAEEALAIERVCRLLARFAYLTEEIDNEKSQSFRAEEQ